MQACVQAAELQHRAAVRARVQNAQLNALSYQDDTAYATLPTTDARAARDPSTHHKRDKSEKSKHKSKDKAKSKDKDKKRKRERRGREEEGGDEEEDTILAKLHKGRSKPQWQIDEEEYDRQCVSFNCIFYVFRLRFSMGFSSCSAFLAAEVPARHP